MSREDFIQSIQDTINFTEKYLYEKTNTARSSNRIYPEGFISSGVRTGRSGAVIAEENTSFSAAKKYSNDGRVAVLNFANPENPGGGVLLGALAQEECLCRSSNLYPCLIDENAYREYYQYHRNEKDFIFSDRLIYTKSVTVFKNDEIIPQLMPETEWFDVDIITCAAPYMALERGISLTELKKIFVSRIQNIFEAAIDNHADVVIVGAFGCGAFKNPPKTVAEAFREVIEKNNYQSAFEKIVFAIKPTGEHCPNVRAFFQQFQGRDSSSLFSVWQKKNPYYGKRVSILGDSISTLEGYNPEGYRLFYTGINCKKSHVHDYRDTWWGKCIDFFGGELLVNNSWSGSRVTRLLDSDSLFPSGCSDERTAALHKNDMYPDLIIIYLGTNDWTNGVEIVPTEFCPDEKRSSSFFESAYTNMLAKIKKNYPDAEIWCCTLNNTYMSENPDFVFPKAYAGIHIDEFNDTIRSAAAASQCRIIDFAGYNRAYNSIDGSHPAADGMNTLAAMAIQELGGDADAKFLDFADDAACNIFCPQQDPVPGSVMYGRYEILKKMNENWLSQSFLAYDRRLHKSAAVKVYDKTQNAFDAVLHDTLLQEAQVRLNLEHPGILKLTDLMENHSYVFCVREIEQGQTLDEVIRAWGAVQENTAVEWAKQLCITLHFFHRMTPPLIYRCLTPENVILTDEGRVKIIDFDDMRYYSFDQKISEGYTCIYAEKGYHAPEQIYGRERTDIRTDIYRLGMLMYHLVTGRNL